MDAALECRHKCKLAEDCEAGVRSKPRRGLICDMKIEHWELPMGRVDMEFGSAACLREGSVFMVSSLERVKEAMAAMPRSEVNVQPLPSLPDLHHSHVPEHIANWLAGGCSLAHIVLFFVAFLTIIFCGFSDFW